MIQFDIHLIRNRKYHISKAYKSGYLKERWFIIDKTQPINI